MGNFKVDTSGSQQAGGSGTYTSNVDYDAMHQEVIDLLGTQKKGKTIVGYISGFIDLGMQPRPDFEKLYDEKDADMVKNLKEGNARIEKKNFFDNGKWHNDAEVFCNPRPPAKAFTLAVDFPQYEIDKGKYFGDEKSNPAPLRLYMGGTWRVNDPDDGARKMTIIQRHMYMTENTNNNFDQWALGTTTTIHKMCVAAGLEDENGLTSKDNITDLLGKSMMFEVQVWNKPDKNDKSKSYYTEKIKFVGEVPEGLTTPAFDDKYIFGVNMNVENDPEMLDVVSAVCKNTMKLAEDYKDSVIKKEIDKAKADWKAQNASKNSSGANTEGKKEKASGNSPKATDDPQIDFDDDIPF